MEPGPARSCTPSGAWQHLSFGFRCQSFFPLIVLTSLTAIAAELPPGTTLSVRQEGTVSTRFSKVGDPVHGVLLSPVMEQRRTILPAGTKLEGTVTMIRKMGLGFKHQSASMALAFHSIRLPGGKEVPIDARMKRVETAKEWVGPDGRIHGIGSVTNVSSSLAVAAWRLLVVAPGVGISVWATKLIFAPAPDTEIVFARGTEYRLELVQPLNVDDTESGFDGLPTNLLSPEIRTDANGTIGTLSSQRANKVSGTPADLVNLVFVGSADGITRAFLAAGWAKSDVKAAGSVVRTYFSILLRRGYKKAPMSTMVMEGNRSDIELQKSLNSFSKRHHLRIWRRPQETGGESVWVAAATEDIGIKFTWQARNFTHVIDGNVDAERTKVVDDLLYTGCVSEAGLIERNNLPSNLENGTGTKLETDGRVAVLRISECAEPRIMPGVGAIEKTSVRRFLAASLRTELIRSNFISLAYNGVRLTSATRWFFERRVPDNTGVRLTRQQLEWLVEDSPVTANPQTLEDSASERSGGPPPCCCNQ